MSKAKAASKLKAVAGQPVARDFVIQMAQTVADSLKRRGANGRLGKQYGDKRDMYNVLGYNGAPTVDDYWLMYLRQDVPKRIIKAKPAATWRNPPVIQEIESPNRSTKFEVAVDQLLKRFNVWSYLKRSDVLAGIGFYGVLLLGARGSSSLDTPIAPGSMSSIEDLLFLSSYSQRFAQVKEFVTDPKSPRFGKPLNYSINLTGDLAGGDIRTSTTVKKSKVANKDVVPVDASRVIHFAEELTEDEVHGTPRLEAPLNRMYDLEKIVGGGAEMYWRGAYGGFALETLADASSTFAASGEIDPTVIDEFAHGMRRWIDLEGYKLNKIEGQDVKPAEIFKVIMQCIAAATDIPLRILMGSEQGELASTDDRKSWRDVITDRQTEYATPIVRDFFDRLILWGILPAPRLGYDVLWPDFSKPTTMEEAEEFSKWADGIAKLAPPGSADMLMSYEEIRTRFLQLPAVQVSSGLEDLDMPEVPAVPFVNGNGNH